MRQNHVVFALRTPKLLSMRASTFQHPVAAETRSQYLEFERAEWARLSGLFLYLRVSCFCIK